MLLTIGPLNDLPGVRHAFFTREGGVSEGLYASLNCGLGSNDEADRVAENRRRALAALDLEAGGEVAANLDALYAFVSERFVDANLRGETAPLEEALGVLTTLHEGWRGAVLGEAAP